MDQLVQSTVHECEMQQSTDGRVLSVIDSSSVGSCAQSDGGDSEVEATLRC